jgi:predicted DNA-binding transcriptional regulator YafY
MSKTISERQFLLVETVMQLELVDMSPATLYRESRVKPLYRGVTERTFYRDIEKLVKVGFLNESENKINVGLLN